MPPLLCAAQAAAAWMTEGLLDQPTPAQALAAAALLLRQCGALRVVPLVIWAAYPLLGQDMADQLPRLRPEAARRLIGQDRASWAVSCLALAAEAARAGLRELARLEAAAAAGAALLDRVQQNDLETTLAEGLLIKADRAGMKSALELRAPFLDRDVLEFAATLPVRERVRGVTTKVFLKRFAARYLPRSVVHRRKRGLSVPLSRWLRGPLSEWAASRLGDARLGAAGVRPAAALALFDEHRARKADHARALWTLIVLSEWLGWVERRGTRDS
jgi:asparagine synthetase B (glutamine-hydrolysing)